MLSHLRGHKVSCCLVSLWSQLKFYFKTCTFAHVFLLRLLLKNSAAVCSVAVKMLGSEYPFKACGSHYRSLLLSCDILPLFSPGSWCQLPQLQHQGEMVCHMLCWRHPVLHTRECLCSSERKHRECTQSSSSCSFFFHFKLKSAKMALIIVLEIVTAWTNT